MSRRSLALILVLTATVAAQPPIFQKLDFAGAKAKAGDRLLVLDAMTSWCGPCKRMDKTTWVDPALVGWMEEHALAIQLDMDEHEQVKNGLRINAFPTIVVFKGGREIDRVVGLREGPWMLEWLKGLEAGVTAKDSALVNLDALRKLEPTPKVLRKRLNLAGEIYAGGELEKATDEYLALWRLIPEHAPRMQYQRRGAMRWNMQALAKRHAPAKTRITTLRDNLTKVVEGDAPDVDALRDWIELNVVLGDDADTVAWTRRRVKTHPELVRRVEHRVFPMCVAAAEWSTAGHTLSNPVAEIRGMGESLGAYDLPTADAPKKTAGKSIPAIPMGGMKPAKKPGAKSVPMIPMGGMKPAKKPVGKPRSIPAIPMGGMKPAKKPVAKPRSIPAIPMGGMKPAKKPMGKPRSIPAIPMGGMKPAKKPAAGTKGMPGIPAAGKARPAPKSPAEIAKDVRSRLTWQMRQRAAERYAALLAAGRVELAAEVAKTALQYADDAATRALLLRRALEAGQMGVRAKQHLVWLDDIAAESDQ